MSSQESNGLRTLKPDDLERVVEIDAAITGRSRRLFFEKRLQAALEDPKVFVPLAVDNADGRLIGFAIARIQNGDFGNDHRIAVLDVIGVDADVQHSGAGRALIDGLGGRLKKLDIGEMRTQVDWQNNNLIHFFAGAGFDLAFAQILERPIGRS